ncbi:MAG: radical SAM protein [Candidatus Omnitrophota bacterium]|nr:radical SAM protein [Candidatus Omnitrophota bacterium]
MIPFPTTIDLAITGKCNLRCKHCNTSGTWKLENELSFEEIVAVLDELKEEKVFNLNLFGGEPFCYPRIFDLFKALNSCPIRVTILTNGTLIDEKAVENLRKLRFLAGIQVSIDGSRAEIHDWQRGEGSFSEAVRAVKMLVENSLPVNIKAIINSHNYRDIENMVAFALSLGLKGMDFGDAVECGSAACYVSDLRFEGEVCRYVMEEIFRIKKKYPGFLIGGTLGQKAGMLKDFYEKGKGKGERGSFSTCPAGQSTLAIRSDGKVVPCSVFWTLVCGDLRKRSLRDIWENSPVLEEIRGLADEPLQKYNPACNDCDYLSFCNGGCRAAAYYSNGCDLKGFEMGNCMNFSSLYGFRVGKETVLDEKGR